MSEMTWMESSADDDRDECETHGMQDVVESVTVPGFTGAPISFWTLACGCQKANLTADSAEAVR